MAELNSMVRVGFVSDIRPDEGLARVCYPSLSNMVSDWLYVMRYPNLQATGTATSDDEHQYSVSITINDWFPNVNDKVLVLMEYGFNSDGFVLGVIP